MAPLANARRVVVKIGTGVLTSGIGNIDTARIGALCKQVASLHSRSIEVVLVSSGSIGLGMGRLGLKERPTELAQLQACAAVGQSILINTWQSGFDPHELTVAQILLTREDLRSKHRHNAIFDTIERLLASGVVPIVNENDTVSASEIQFGDNDTLSALVASVMCADLLFILSNIPGLIDKQGSGQVVPLVEKITPGIEAMAEGTRQSTSVGGMISKLSAAKIAQRAGCGVLIGSGQDETLFDAILDGQQKGTYFTPNSQPVQPEKRWIAIQDKTSGILTINADGETAITQSGTNLLTAHITNCEGDFSVGDLVHIQNTRGKRIAQGQVQLSSAELAAGGSAIAVHHDDLVRLD
ncbi:MAG: glutamate 5-kinase [Coraliomargarita sp.]